jgi:4-aminobutyrate aminotransferase-like enzyme
MYDGQGRKFLDLQMWYSAVNFGYKNQRLSNAVRRQLDTLPQVASQYLHREKIELAAMIAKDAERKFGEKGRVHFNVGGSQAIEDSLKLVRNFKGGKTLMLAFEGGYHGRTLGASAITSSYRYRRRYGHFGDRAQFIPFPYQFRGPKGMTKEEYGHHCVQQFARLFESEYYGLWDPKANEAEYAAFYVEPLQGTGGYVLPPQNFFKELKKVLDKHGILMVVDEIQMGFFRTGKLWSIEHFGVTPDVIVFGKAITNGLNPLSGLWAKEAMINPQTFPVGSTHSTFNANPMGTGVALEAMKMMAETDYEAMVMKKGAYLLDGLKALKEKYKIVGDVDGLGMALRMEICEPHDSFTPAKRLVDMMVDMGLEGDIDVDGQKFGCVLDIGGYYKNVITLAPNLHMTTEEIDLGLKLLDRLLNYATSRA